MEFNNVDLEEEGKGKPHFYHSEFMSTMTAVWTYSKLATSGLFTLSVNMFLHLYALGLTSSIETDYRYVYNASMSV